MIEEPAMIRHLGRRQGDEALAIYEQLMDASIVDNFQEAIIWIGELRKEL